MHKFSCPYLKSEVELTDEREIHITQTHPDVLPEYLPQVQKTLLDPDEVRRSVRMSGARMFYRWFEDVRQGKYVAVVVVSDAPPAERHWIITAYITRRLINGEPEWQKS